MVFPAVFHQNQTKITLIWQMFIYIILNSSFFNIVCLHPAQQRKIKTFLDQTQFNKTKSSSSIKQILIIQLENDNLASFEVAFITI